MGSALRQGGISGDGFAKTRPKPSLLLLLGAAILPILAGKGLTQGHDLSPLPRSSRPCWGISSSLRSAPQWRGLACCSSPMMSWTHSGALWWRSYAALWATALLAIGAVWGLATRPHRKRTFAIAAHNARFLRDSRITETNAKDASHVGPGANDCAWSATTR